jgi:hypothetical protein
MGTGDFTIDLWVYVVNISSQMIFVDMRGGTPTVAAPVIYMNTSGALIYYVNGAAQITSAAITPTSWNHIAVSRSSTSTKLFINGVQSGSTYNDSNNYIQSSVFIGRASDAATLYLNGYVSNFRIVKGTAVYTTNFTPSTIPLTATQSANVNGNPSAAITGTQTSLLTCQSNRFKDNSSNNFTITVNGTLRTQAFQPFSPTASYTTAAYGGSMFGSTGTTTGVVVPDNAAFTCAGDFTSELWYYPLASSSFVVVMGFYDGTFQPWSIVHDTNNFTIYVSSNFSSWNIANGTVLGAVVYGQWNHLAVVRSGTSTGNLKFYINGSLATSVTYTGTIDPTQGLRFYCSSGGAYSSNARFVNGTAVYTAAFTPPTVPLTAITNTSLLLNYTNAGIYDAAVQNNEVTVGSAQTSITQFKWSPTSMRFNGTTDYLTSVRSDGYNLGTAYTVEAWVYPSSVSGNQGIINLSTGATVNAGFNFYLVGSTVTVNNGSLGGTGPSGGTLATGQWYYIAIVSNGTNTVLYINGTLTNTYVGVTGFSGTWTNATIGNIADKSMYFNGYIQDLRITKGIARTITTPTAAFPTR